MATTPTKPVIGDITSNNTLLTVTVTGDSDATHYINVYKSTSGLVGSGTISGSGTLTIELDESGIYVYIIAYAVRGGLYSEPCPGIIYYVSYGNESAAKVTSEVITDDVLKDFDPSFNFGASYDINVVTGETAIESQVENRLGINPGERVMRPRWGAGLITYLGRPMNESTATFMSMAIEESFSNDEYITLHDVAVIPNYDENRYDVFLLYAAKNKKLGIVAKAIYR